MIKLFGVTFTYNESAMIPYVMKYAEHAGFDKFIVYDNESTDNTVKLLKKYPFVEVRTLRTGGKKSNQAITDVKNTVWKEFNDIKNAWIFIADFDEVIYYDGNLKEYLEKAGDEGYNCLNQDMVETICKNFPDKNKFVHEGCNGGLFWGNSNTGGCKMTLFKSGVFKNVKYLPGAHTVNVVLNTGLRIKSLNEKKIKSFHLKFIDFDYCLKRKNIANNRRGPDDIRKNYGYQYTISDSEFKEKLKTRLRKVFDIKKYLSGELKGQSATSKIKHREYTRDKTIDVKMVSEIQGNQNIKIAAIERIKARRIIRKEKK